MTGASSPPSAAAITEAPPPTPLIPTTIGDPPIQTNTASPPVEHAIAVSSPSSSVQRSLGVTVPPTPPNDPPLPREKTYRKRSPPAKSRGTFAAGRYVRPPRNPRNSPPPSETKPSNGRSRNQTTTAGTEPGDGGSGDSASSHNARREATRLKAMEKQSPLQNELTLMAQSHASIWCSSPLNSPPETCLHEVKQLVDDWCVKNYNGRQLGVYVFFCRAQGFLAYLLAATVYKNYPFITRFHRWRDEPLFHNTQIGDLRFFDENMWGFFFRQQTAFLDAQIINQIK